MHRPPTSEVKPGRKSERAPHRAGAARTSNPGLRGRTFLEQRERVRLLLLWVLSLGSLLLVWPDPPPWAAWVAQVGPFPLAALLLWWAVTGFSGYEQRAGRRILRRAPPGRAAGRRALTRVVVAVVIAAGGILAMWFDVRSAPVAIVVAVSTLAALVIALAHRFAVFATLSIVGIAIGVAALIVVQSVATGFQHEFERRVLGVYSHINVTRAFGIAEYRRFEAYLRNIDGVVGASPFVYYAMALAPHDPAGAREGDLRRASVLVKGIDPGSAAEVIDITEHLEHAAEGEAPKVTDLVSDLVLEPQKDRENARLPEVIANTPDPRGEGWYPKALAEYRSQPDHREYGHRPTSLDEDDWIDPDAVANVELDPTTLPTIFVGITLARELELEAEDVVTLVDPGATYDHREAPMFRYYRVAGIFRAGFQEYDSRLVYVHVKELSFFKYRGRDAVSGIDLRLADPYDAPRVEAILRRTVGTDREYSILEWQTLNANLFQSIRTQKSILTVILSLVSTVAGFNVLAALWTMVVRRTPEIAIMMSMGATESGVARIFQFTGMTIGAVGCIAGVGFGLVLCALVRLYGYTLDPEVYFIEQLPVEINLAQVVAIVLLTMVISFVATIPPSLRAAKLRPVEGLRYE